MHKQKGVALIVVMSLLAVSLTLGLMSMQSSQVDERLAGNYKAAAEAQMAAEFGAAYGIQKLRDPGESLDALIYNRACEDFAEAGLSEQERRGLDGDFEWYEVDGVDAEIIGCKYDGEELYLSWGQVRDGGGSITSERFVVFGDGGDPWPLGPAEIKALNENALLVGGALVRNGRSDVLGPEPRFNIPGWADVVPNPQQVVDWVAEKSDAGSPRVVNSCNARFSAGEAEIVFCDGDFLDDLDDRLSGMIVVAAGNIGNWTPGNQRVNVKGNVDAYLVSGGSMNFSGFGNNAITGGVWVGGGLDVNGSSNFCGSVIVRGAASFNGSSSFDIESDECMPSWGRGGEPVWRPL